MDLDELERLARDRARFIWSGDLPEKVLLLVSRVRGLEAEVERLSMNLRNTIDYAADLRDHKDKLPRRCKLWLNHPAEMAIRAAIHAVELMGADPRLTDVVVALDAAREKLADYVDDIGWAKETP